MENANKELIKLIIDNPDLPIIPIINNDIKLNDDFESTVCEIKSARIDEYVYVEDDNSNVLYAKSEQDALEDYFMSVLLDESDELTDAEIAKLAHERAEGLNWTKAIIVYIAPSKMR